MANILKQLSEAIDNASSSKMKLNEKAQALEEIKEYGTFEEVIYRSEGLKEAANRISEIVEKAEQVALQETEEWFDEEVYKLFTEGRMNPRFLSERVKPSNEKVSMVRVPTRCPICKRQMCLRDIDNNKFEPGYLDQSVYKTIPMVKGVCHKCKNQ